MAVGTKPESFFSFRWLSERNLKIFFHSDGGRNQTWQFFLAPMAVGTKPENLFSFQWWPQSNLTVFFGPDGCRNKT
jgi:hypothetical protein